MTTSASRATRATPSAELPADFHRPAPLRRTGELSRSADRHFTRSRTASLALLRIVAFGTGVSWLVFMALGGHTHAAYLAALRNPTGSAVNLVWLLFTLAAVTVIAAGFIHRERFYRWALLTAGGSYLVVLTIHLGLLALTGSSPLAQMYLGDFVGLPMAMLMAVLPGRIGIPLAVVAIGLACAVNLGTPLGFNTVLEVAHAEILMVPFLVLLQSGRSASATLDEAASRAHRDAERVARLKTLGELETRFLGHVHDRVLTYLDGVRRGVVSPDDADVRSQVLLPAAPAPSAQLGVDTVVRGMVSEVHGIAPGMTVTAPDTVPGEATIPADAAAALTDALLETVHNSLTHAPDARAECVITGGLDGGTCTGVCVVVRDEGPGFDLNRIARHRAGIRVAVMGRMQSTDGCDVEIDTAPGRGTVVTLSWRPDGPSGREPVSGDMTVPSVYELVGVGRIFRPANAVLVFAVFVGLSLNNHHPEPGLYLLALTAAAVAVGALVQGRELRLPGRATACVAGSAVVFFAAASLESLTPAEHWPAIWFPWVFVLLCTYLAIRDRAAVAWAVWAGCLTVLGVVSAAGWFSPVVEALEIIQVSALLLPATFIPHLVKLTTRGLPVSLAAARSQATALQVVATQRRFLSDSAEWIREQVEAALHPRFSGETRRDNAHLLERKLRDSIRSPLFDTPETNRAVWDARARGVGVRLLDDRSSLGALAEEPLPENPDPRLAETRDTVVGALSEGEVEEVTARIFPSGRSVYATVLVTAGGETTRLSVS